MFNSCTSEFCIQYEYLKFLDTESSNKTWEKPERKATEKEEQMMMAEALAVIVKVLMNNHIYTFGGKLHLQAGKGSIGDRATGIIAQLIMIWWDRTFKLRLNELDVKFDLIERFIDDINAIFDILKPGTEYKDGKIVYNPEKVEEDSKLPDDKRTMEIVKKIANDIEGMIKMTVDVPSNYEDEKLPVLDTKVWLNKRNQLLYSFYEKPMKNRSVISKNSALPMKQKITIQTQEVFRRLHNTKYDLDEEIRDEILSKFMEDIKISGYNERERKTILKGGILTYEKLRKKESDGIRPFYRPGNYKKEERKKKKRKN